MEPQWFQRFHVDSSKHTTIKQNWLLMLRYGQQGPMLLSDTGYVLVAGSPHLQDQWVQIFEYNNNPPPKDNDNYDSQAMVVEQQQQYKQQHKHMQWNSMG